LPLRCCLLFEILSRYLALTVKGAEPGNEVSYLNRALIVTASNAIRIKAIKPPPNKQVEALV
jgi:hypothetical protein